MGEKTTIEWCHHTWNPWWGCTKVSPGCDHCYAEGVGARFGTPWGAGQPRRYFSDRHWDEPRRWDTRAARAGVRRRVFCASMGDVFDNEVPAGERQRLFKLFRETPNLDWLVLTKRIGNAARMLPSDWDNGYPNIWLMATVVDQSEFDRDVGKLLDIPAVIHGLSIEPMLGAINIDGATRLHSIGGAGRIDWIIVGGESGSNARPMHPQWATQIRDQCVSAGVAFFFKQHGSWMPIDEWRPWDKRRQIAVHVDGSLMAAGEWHGDAQRLMAVPKAVAGRAIDGREYSEFPCASSMHRRDA